MRRSTASSSTIAVGARRVLPPCAWAKPLASALLANAMLLASANAQEPVAPDSASLDAASRRAEPSMPRTPIRTTPEIPQQHSTSGVAAAARAAPTQTASLGSLDSAVTAPGNVTVITRRELELNGWRSVADALHRVPGFYVTDDGSLTSVAVRGFSGGIHSGTRLLEVLINGVAVNFRPELRAFIGREYVPIEAIERIEIVKGPLSALYGANAAVATVNVITRKPGPGAAAALSGAVLAQNADRSGFGGSGVVHYGSAGATLLLAVSSYRIAQSGLRIERTFPAQNPELPRYAPFFRESSHHDRSEPSSAFLQLALEGRALGRLSVDAGLQRLDENAEFRPNAVLTHQSRESLLNGYVNVRHEKAWSSVVESHLVLGISSGAPTRDDRLFVTGVPSQTFTRNYGYRALTAALAVEFAPTPAFSARLGFDADVELHDIAFYTVTFASDQGNRRAGESVDLIGANVERTRTLSDRAVHLQLRGRPLPLLDGLEITANARADFISYGGYQPPTALSARAAIVYTWAPWLVTKLLGGRSFHVPSAVMLFAESGFGIANNLIGSLSPTSGVDAPETQVVTSAELVASTALGDVAFVDLSGFVQKVEHPVEFVPDANDFIATNVDGRSFIGVEGTLRTQLGPVNPFIAGAWVTPDDEATMVGYPKFVGEAGLNVTLFDEPGLSFNGRVRHVSSRRASGPNQIFNDNDPYSLPAYQTLDLALALVHLPLLGRGTNTELHAAANNVLDQRHSEAGFVGFDVPALGRTGFLEIRQTF